MKDTGAFIMLLISAGLFYTFIMPEYAKVKALQAEASTYSDTLKNVEDLSNERDELSLKYKAMPKDQVDNLKKILPDNVNIVELTLNIDAIASKYGISIKDIRTADDSTNQNAATVTTPQTGPYQKVTVSFSFIASYDSYRKFQHDLEESMRLIEVKNVSFASAENNLMQFQMQIETYWLK